MDEDKKGQPEDQQNYRLPGQSFGDEQATPRPEQPSAPPKFIPQTPRGPASVRPDTPHSVQKTSGLAIASLILAFLCAPLGLILGIVALVKINKNRDTVAGSGLAISGIVVGGLGVFVMIIMSAILFPVFAKAREKARQTSCCSNMKQLSMSLLMYSQDHNDKFPTGANWNQAIRPYMPKNNSILACPTTGCPDPAYALSANVSGKKAASFKEPFQAVALFECEPGANRAGGPELLPIEPRHSGGENYAFVDGHVKWIRRGSTPQ